MTEDEAKTKWCPMVRMEGPTNTDRSQNRWGDGDPIGQCIASDCMMWRPEYEVYRQDETDRGPTEEGWYIVERSQFQQIWQRAVGRGHCGLSESVRFIETKS